MKDAQERLDKGADALMRLIVQAEEAARETCGEGEHEASANFHEMAAHMRMAYAIGRRLAVQDDCSTDIIRPRSGGK